MCNLGSHLSGLACEFPSYTFTITHGWHGYAIAAVRRDDSPGPLVVVSSDLDELREHLSRRGRTIVLSDHSPANENSNEK